MVKLPEMTIKILIIFMSTVIMIFIATMTFLIYAYNGKNGDHAWNGCSVPYLISEDFSGEEIFTIKKTMNYLSKESEGIKFVEKTNQIEFVEFVKQDIDYLNTCGTSKLGKQFGGQQIVINTNCYTSKKLIIHEIMHALGFSHEHQRPDRENHIIINKHNIKETKLTQYEIRENIVWKKIVKDTDYDYNSIMHYIIDNERIKLLDNNIILENKNELSLGDIEKLKKYYKTFK